MQSDQELMMQAAEGRMEAFETLVRRHQQRAWRIAYHYTGNRDDAEEVAQQAFLNILDAADSYTPSARFTTYLYRVIANLCMDRTRKRSPRFSGDLPEQDSPAPAPDRRMADRERDRAIGDALDELTDRQRMATVVRYYEDLSYREIAEAMDATPKAVERLLARARKALGKKLGEFGEK